MQHLGAEHAMNLDGGGSSTLVAAGLLLNRPIGDTAQREVVSALVTYCRGT
jgi:exopolysaccharide biosynthesis protein